MFKIEYMIGVGFEILARSPVPKLPPSSPTPEHIYRVVKYKANAFDLIIIHL